MLNNFIEHHKFHKFQASLSIVDAIIGLAVELKEFVEEKFKKKKRKVSRFFCMSLGYYEISALSLTSWTRITGLLRAKRSQINLSRHLGNG